MNALRAVLSHRSAAIGLALVLFVVLTALLAPWLAPHDPYAQYRKASGVPPGLFKEEPGRENLYGRANLTMPPTWFPLGTDINGRDILTRVMYGARISLLVGLVATALALTLGTLIGVLAGYFGGWLDSALMRVADMFFAFPGILLAIIIMATLSQPAVREALAPVARIVDPSILGLFFALGLTGWAGVSRIIRGEVLALKEREFVEAARAMGCSHARIMLVHMIPNCRAPLIVVGTLDIAAYIVAEAGLSFLGLGVQPPAASWGAMLAESRPYLSSMPWWGIFPGVALAVTVLGFNLLGDGLRDLLDPRQRSRVV